MDDPTDPFESGASRTGPRTATVASDRAQNREAYLHRHLDPLDVQLTDLAPTTRRSLHEYARFMLVLADARSVTWSHPVLELCKAVESELAFTFRHCQALRGLQNATTLGEKANEAPPQTDEV
jgi:hypothetical protein